MAGERNGEAPPAWRAGLSHARTWQAAAALLGLIAAVLALTTVRALDERDRALTELADLQRMAEQEVQASRDAEAFLSLLFNWDGTTIDTDFDAILARGTDQFRLDASQYADPDVRTALRDRRATSLGDVRHLWLQELETDRRATFFAVIDQTIANVNFGPVQDEVRLEFTLERQSDGTWAVHGLSILQAPTEIVAPGTGLVGPPP